MNHWFMMNLTAVFSNTKLNILQLNENPAYGKQVREVDIKFEDCPAYMEPKKDQTIKIEDCLTYEEPGMGQGIKLEECPAYGNRTVKRID